jgi:uncharacterized coiled-coil protein SlyX/uncharacterized protein YciU (UPF0263 family)
MERTELLTQFNELLDTYGKHKSYADKAREKATQFSSAVIEKVIADHQIKSSLIADDIQPLVPLLQAELATINESIGGAEQSKGDLGARIEELELRLAIGEISDEEFETMTADGRDTVNEANSEIDHLVQGRDEVQALLDRWAGLSGDSAEAQPIAAVSEESEGDDDFMDDESLVVEAAIVEEDDGEVSEGFDPVVNSILPGFEDEIEGESVEIEGAEAAAIDMPSPDDVAFAVDESDAGGDESVDVLPVDDGEVAVEVAIEDSEVAEIGVEASEEGDDDADDGEARRAILLSNEGTPDEQIYALTGEVFTVGRGRDNDLQIKNDSKVSRFHCKVYRRGANYYLEDNKSSNGTMVNGELISERRLFGGEELVIGETFFRFRVM